MKRFLLRLSVTVSLIFLFLPIVVVVISSFNTGGIFTFPPKAWGLGSYSRIGSHYFDSLQVSVIVGVLTTLIAVFIGVPAALALARSEFRGRDALNAACLSPLMVPALVTGVALYQYSLVMWDITGVGIAGSIGGLVFGHLTFAIPFVVRAVLASHAQYDITLEEAARNLGATPLLTFRRITLPVLKPGIVSGSIFAFLISMDEVPISLFMGGGDATTLPVRIFAAIEIEFGGEILAVSSIVVMGSIVLMFVVDRLVGLDKLFMSKG